MNYEYHIFSPYRVCPIGAHIDHQHGIVTGFAINKGVDFWFSVRDDNKVRLSSKTFEVKGVYGGRFSGAGFKGAVIALVDPAEKYNIEAAITEQYLQKFPEYKNSFKVFWTHPDDGARFLGDWEKING